MNRQFAFDLIGAVIFGIFLYIATIIGNIASFYISKALG
jgi:hypothetical protein